MFCMGGLYPCLYVLSHHSHACMWWISWESHCSMGTAKMTVEEGYSHLVPYVAWAAILAKCSCLEQISPKHTKSTWLLIQVIIQAIGTVGQWGIQLPKKYNRNIEVKYQLTPPSIYQRNATMREIQTWKIILSWRCATQNYNYPYICGIASLNREQWL